MYCHIFILRHPSEILYMKLSYLALDKVPDIMHADGNFKSIFKKEYAFQFSVNFVLVGPIYNMKP